MGSEMCIRDRPNPTIDTFTISAQSINLNESITLSWSSSNTTECTADGDWNGSKELNGTETIQLTQVKTYAFDLSSSIDEDEDENDVIDGFVGEGGFGVSVELPPPPPPQEAIVIRRTRGIILCIILNS